MGPGSRKVDRMTRSRAILTSYIGVLVFAAPVFLGAGRLLFRQGILYVGAALVGTTLSHLLVRADSNITVDRAARAQHGQDWDKRILGVYFLANLVMFTVAGLDSGRFGWSGHMSSGVAIAGVTLMLLGQIVFALAKRENAFFSSTVRIQDERGHRVCDTGLYSFVRHPGYAGMFLSLLAFPLIMESYWAVIPMCVGVLFLVVRTYLEDRFLTTELPGYAEYVGRTRWRLIPGVF